VGKGLPLGLVETVSGSTALNFAWESIVGLKPLKRREISRGTPTGVELQDSPVVSTVARRACLVYAVDYPLAGEATGCGREELS